MSIPPKSTDDLCAMLSRIDGRGYKAYKDLTGGYRSETCQLFIDHVQADPFAAPSRLRLRVLHAVAGFPVELSASRVRRTALEDSLARAVRDTIGQLAPGARGTGKSGLITIGAGRQEVLERTAVRVCDEWVEARIEVGLPAAGRRVLGKQAEQLLCAVLPRIVTEALTWRNTDAESARAFVECVENQDVVRTRLGEMGLVAFVADGAILPRESGASDRPLRGDEAISFVSPESLRVAVEVPNPVDLGNGPASIIRGMGIPEGVTLIVGGGYHGKSTLLRAIERGVYPHVPGDGREYVVTRADAVKIRAEDGRRVERVDISPFIADLPYGRGTKAFCTDDASGSTSQAANIVEAVEAGAGVLLLDEDSSATNFMVRDARMQALVSKPNEPITPFVDRVRDYYEQLGVSTVLVMGGCGDYFDAADTVIAMRRFLPEDVTADAKRIAAEKPTSRNVESRTPLVRAGGRVPDPRSIDASRGRREVKIDAKSLHHLRFGEHDVDLRAVEQLVDIDQTRAAGYAIYLAAGRVRRGEESLSGWLRRVDEYLDDVGVDGLGPFRRRDEHPGRFARPRRFEIAAALNRLRTLRVESTDPP